MKHVFKRIIAMLLAISMLATMAACGGETSADTSSSSGSAENSGTEGEVVSSKDTLIMVSPYSDPGTYNSFLNATSQSSVVTEKIFNKTFVWGDGGAVEMQLAESYEWENDTALIVRLRDDVYFHNGEKMTADDVIFSNELAQQAPAKIPDWKPFDSIEKIDENTIRYNVKYQDIGIFNAFTRCDIVPKAYYEEVGEQQFGLNPIGTNYYMWDSYTSGDNVTLKAFDQYWGEHGTIETLIVRFISETSQALIELESNNVDMISADGSTLDLIEGNDNIAVLRYDSMLNEYCGFNFNSEKVQDIRVRLAVNYGIDRDAIISGAREGLASPSYSLVLPALSNFYEPSCEDMGYDPEKAKELMAEMGYSTENPLELNLLTDTSNARSLEAQQIKNMLDELGFLINIVTYESATVTSILAGGDPNDYDMVIRALGIGSEPLNALQGTMGLDATAANNNPLWLQESSHEKVKEYDELISQAKQTMDDDERAELLKELQRIEREIVMAVWLLGQESCYALNSKLQGLYFIGTSLCFEKAYFIE